MSKKIARKAAEPGPGKGTAQEQPSSTAADQPSGEGDAEYEVGYGKPPKAHQFPKNNKFGKGRKKGSKALKTIVNEAFGLKMSVKIGGKTKKLSKFELAMHQLASKASAGDLKAIERAIPLIERYGPQEDPDGPPPEKVKRDLAALKAYIAMKEMIDPDSEETGGD